MRFFCLSCHNCDSLEKVQKACGFKFHKFYEIKFFDQIKSWIGLLFVLFMQWNSSVGQNFGIIIQVPRVRAPFPLF